MVKFTFFFLDNSRSPLFMKVVWSMKKFLWWIFYYLIFGATRFRIMKPHSSLVAIKVVNNVIFVKGRFRRASSQLNRWHLCYFEELLISVGSMLSHFTWCIIYIINAGNWRRRILFAHFDRYFGSATLLIPAIGWHRHIVCFPLLPYP